MAYKICNKQKIPCFTSNVPSKYVFIIVQLVLSPQRLYIEKLYIQKRYNKLIHYLLQDIRDAIKYTN